ncbi:MAG: carboxypeptidase regulatory-like domain-containing protein, partial [Gemmatimonadota bacterium]|nr:carboxypeptidase regulatory-like domain-containing protein [Gemmatimonadota bacterium]
MIRTPTGPRRGASRTYGRFPAAATRTAHIVLLAALVPLGLAAQDHRQIALLKGRVGIEPEPGSLLASPARLTVERLPLDQALARLSERTRVQIAFSPALLPAGHPVDCDCAALVLARALDRLLEGTGLGYAELGSQVVVVPREETVDYRPDEVSRSGTRILATLTGIVRDDASLEPIAFATVAVSPQGTASASLAGSSDRFGTFVIPGTPAGPVRIEANAFGYAEWARDYDELPAAPVEVLLIPAPIVLDPLGVKAPGRAGDPISFSRDAFVVDPVMVQATPTVLETDVLRVLAMSPSASAPSDFVSVPYVRGGTSEGTPVLLDGVRLFNPFHLGGFFSAINPEAVDHAALLPSSAAGAQHIGSLSGAVEIATRDGARDRHRVAGAVGLASSRLSVEGPIGGGTSYLVNGRRTYIDMLTSLAEEEVSQFPYSFSDLHGKITHDFGGFRRFSATGYVNSEGVRYENNWNGRSGKSDWGNSAVAAHYRDRLGGGILLDVTIGRSRFRSDMLETGDLGQPAPDTVVGGGGQMTEDRADFRATWHLASGTFTTGGQAIRFDADHHFTHSGLSEVLDFIDVVRPLELGARQWRVAVFANLDMSLRRSWRSRAGVRLDRFMGVANTLSPFAELGYAETWWVARISVARSYQSLASLRNEESLGAGFVAYDLIAPVQSGPVPRNTEISAGWEGSRGASRLRLDAYGTCQRLRDTLRNQFSDPS